MRVFQFLLISVTMAIILDRTLITKPLHVPIISGQWCHSVCPKPRTTVNQGASIFKVNVKIPDVQLVSDTGFAPWLVTQQLHAAYVTSSLRTVKSKTQANFLETSHTYLWGSQVCPVTRAEKEWLLWSLYVTSLPMDIYFSVPGLHPLL